MRSSKEKIELIEIYPLICWWCERNVGALTRAIVNATQEETAVCDSCLEKYGDDATGEINSVRDPYFDAERKGSGDGDG